MQPVKHSKEKPAIMLAAPELSHRVMSGPPPLVGGSTEVLLKERGLGLHVTVFECTAGQKTTPLSHRSFDCGEKLGAHTYQASKKESTQVWFQQTGLSNDRICIHGRICLHACLLTVMCADLLTLE